MKKLLSILIVIIVLLFFLMPACSQKKSSPAVPMPPTQTPTITPIPGSVWHLATGSAAFSAREGHTSVVYNNEMWVIAGRDSSGDKNDVWRSIDGINWKQATAGAAFNARRLHTSVIYDNYMWVIGGYNDSSSSYYDDVWYSSDGISWTQVTGEAFTPTRREHTSVVYDSAIWVIAGAVCCNSYKSTLGLAPGTYYYPYDDNDVWYSNGGGNWTYKTKGAAFGIREGHTSVVYDNEMWVIAGVDVIINYSKAATTTYNYYNDVWYSSNGADWTEVTGTAGFSPRGRHTSVIYNNEMWVIGGYNGSNLYNDVYHSSGDVNWQETAVAAPFSPRFGHTSVVYNVIDGSAMWVIGGNDSSGFKNDVWWAR